jgi:hypothetical protein
VTSGIVPPSIIRRRNVLLIHLISKFASTVISLGPVDLTCHIVKKKKVRFRPKRNLQRRRYRLQGHLPFELRNTLIHPHFQNVYIAGPWGGMRIVSELITFFALAKGIPGMATGFKKRISLPQPNAVLSSSQGVATMSLSPVSS